MTPTCDWIEYLDLARAVLAEPLGVQRGHVTASSAPGAGLAWDADAVKRSQLS